MLVFLGLNTSCVQEEIQVPPPAPEQGFITLYFKDMSEPTTRALTDEQENAVKTIDVLAFRLNYGQLQFAYHVYVQETDIHPVSGDNTRKEFQIKVPKDKDRYRYVLIANANTEVDAYLKAGNREYESIDAFLPKIVMENKPLWKAESASNFKPIPMWGETEGEKTLGEIDKKDIELFRSLARVDVKVETTVPFDLQEIYVYNRPSRGRIAPDRSHWDNTQKRFTSPSLPDNLGIVDVVALNNNKYIVPPGQRDFVSEIYLFETRELGSQDFVDATCLVLGGMYQGSLNYYRVDFAEISNSGSTGTTPGFDWEQGPPSSGTGEGGMVGTGENYHPLIRNHHYELKITGVSGKGFALPDSAARSIGSQLATDFVTWNDNTQNIVIDNTSYTLNISPSVLTITQADPAEIIISTNYPQPEWNLTEPSEPWFECQLNAQNDKISVSFKTGATAPANGSVGYFKVRLMKGNKAKVSQQIKVVYN
ncbi:MAG: hypothetical protein LBQ65_01705 [Tannerellaceae bacterium]|nr:hypothetical protein [Tannerellaceae bacterium]